MVQVNPAAVQVVMETADGAELALEPGRQVVARVVDVANDGSARISLAGQILSVKAAEANLRAGDEIRLSVAQADANAVRMTIIATSPPPVQAGVGGTAAQLVPSAMSPVPQALPASSAIPVPTVPPAGGAGVGVAQPGVAPIASELAKAGVPVAPELAGTVARIVEQLGQHAQASRAVAQLAGRDLALSPAAASRVAATLELAGSLGPALDSLASRAPAIAAAIPTSTPGAAALRNMLAPNLEPAELAIARIVEASSNSAAARNAGTGSTLAAVAGDEGMPTVAAPVRGDAAAASRSYLTSGKLSADALLASVNTRPDAATLRAQTAATPPLASTTAPPLGAPASAAQQAVRASIIGTSSIPQAAQGATLATPNAATGATPQPGAVPQPAANTAATQNALPLPRTLLNSASAAAATGSASAVVAQTEAPVAQAVADLATLTARIAPASGQTAGVLADAASAQAKGTNAAQIAQQAGAAGSAGAASASNAGAGASGDPAPVVTAVSEFLRSGGSDSDAAKLMNALRGASSQTVATALQRLPESDVLRFAGALLELVPDAEFLPPGVSADALRADVRGALDHLGRALRPDAAPNDELAQLRTALQHVADTDARPAVAQDAQRMLAALDGQQIMSRQQNGADAGYLYFQLPMPNGRGAEVLVRREPGRRAVTFDEFNIAFLLDTERLGTLMISLDAQPSGIRADVKTDAPGLEEFLEAESEALLEPLAREGRRPVQVTVGSFDAAPPTSLLEPQLGMIEPGSREFYA